MQPELDRFKALFRRVEAEEEAEAEAMNVCFLSDASAHLWFSPVRFAERFRACILCLYSMPGLIRGTG